MTKVAQIIPYFGKWPEWIELFLYSCSRNQMIDFYIYTDCRIPDNIPDSENIKIISISYSDYKSIVTDRLRKYGGFFVTNQKYKLTDLKPFLGLIHENVLKDYDWWGFGDLDLVYGDLSILINEQNLKRYNLITTHNYHIAGHCTFMRNNEYYRTLCLRIKDWQVRLTEDKHYGFDEAEWSNLVYRNIKYPLFFWSRILFHICPHSFNRFMDTANSVLSPRQLFKEFYTTPAPKIGEQWVFDVNNCSIKSPTGYNLPYLHFLFFKKTPWLKTNNYWREGYWGINGKISDYNRITIDVTKVSGIK